MSLEVILYPAQAKSLSSTAGEQDRQNRFSSQNVGHNDARLEGIVVKAAW